MRHSRKMLVVILAGGILLAFATWWFLGSDYRRFMWHKDQHYYVEFGRACDSVLSAHPLGTNEFIRIPGTDPSLPKVIRDLHPDRITLSPKRVHLMVGLGRGGFGIAWEQFDSMHWSIITFAESHERIAYAQ